LEVNNTKGVETVISHAFTAGGMLSHDVILPIATNAGYKTDLLLALSRENQCVAGQYPAVEVNTTTCTACNAAFTECFAAESGGSVCAGSGYINIVSRADCLSECTTGTNFTETLGTFAKECNSCADFTCKKCSKNYYTCEEYNVGNVNEVRYKYFNETNSTVLIRFKNKINQTRMGEYVEAAFNDPTLSNNYKVLWARRYGDYDLRIKLDLFGLFGDATFDTKINRTVNYFFDSPKDFSSIKNQTISVKGGSWSSETL